MARVNDFRPISLVTSLYKVISKVLATRLKKVLPSIINDSQMAFVEGRQILDAILTASEAVDEWSLRGRKGVLLKLDLEKAYDKVDWSFLDMAMKLKGFGKRWRKWIWGCLSTTNFSIIVNSRPRGKIIAKRDIRQGDPLAPFLFTIVGDALSCLIHYCNEKRNLKDFHFENLSDDLTHLQYADDTLLFSSWEDGNLENWWKVIISFLWEPVYPLIDLKPP